MTSLTKNVRSSRCAYLEGHFAFVPQTINKVSNGKEAWWAKKLSMNNYSGIPIALIQDEVQLGNVRCLSSITILPSWSVLMR